MGKLRGGVQWVCRVLWLSLLAASAALWIGGQYGTFELPVLPPVSVGSIVTPSFRVAASMGHFHWMFNQHLVQPGTRPAPGRVAAASFRRIDCTCKVQAYTGYIQTFAPGARINSSIGQWVTPCWLVTLLIALLPLPWMGLRLLMRSATSEPALATSPQEAPSICVANEGVSVQPDSAQVLAYATPATPQRPPAILHILGAFSIVIGGISALFGLGGSAYTLYLSANSIPPSRPSARPALPAVSLAPYSGQTLRSGGLNAEARRQIIASTHFNGLFAEDRAIMFDRLLGEAGEAIAGANPSTFPSSTGKPDDAFAIEQLNCPGGCVQVSPTYAQFIPSGQTADSPTSVRVERDQVVRNGKRTWSAVVMDEYLNEVRSGLPGVTPLQLSSLAQLMENTVLKPSTPDARAAWISGHVPPVSGASRTDSGILQVSVYNGGWFILPDGRSVSQAEARWGIDVKRGAPNAAPPPPFQPMMPGSPWALGGLGLLGLASAAASCLLFSAGWAATHGASRAVPLHVRWAGIKLLLIAADIAFAWWYVASYPHPWMGGPSPIIAGMWISLIVGTLLQLIYPAIVLLVVSHSKAVGQWEATWRRDRPLHPSADSVTWVGKWLPPVTQVACVGFGIANFAMGAWYGWGEGIHFVQAGAHVVIGAVFIAIAFRAGRFRVRALAPAMVSVLLLAAVLLPVCPAWAATTEPSAAADAEADRLGQPFLKEVQSNRGSTRDFEKLVRMGEPAQIYVLTKLAADHCANSSQVDFVVREWGRMGLTVSERHKAQAVDLLPKIAQSVRIEAAQALRLYGKMPELAPYYAKMITDYDDRVRDVSIDGMMEIDPSGKMAVDAVREAMKHPSGGHDYRYYKPLQRIGLPAVPMLVELSYSPDLDTRLNVIRSLRPLDGKSFWEEGADRLVDLHVDPFSDLIMDRFADRHYGPMLRNEVITSLRAMGEQGGKLAADLKAGRRPPSQRRQRMQLPAEPPDRIRLALMPGDPSAGIPDAHWKVIQETAARYQENPRAAVDDMLARLNDSDEGIRLIAVRFLAAAPETGSQADDLSKLTKAGDSKSLAIRNALAPRLLSDPKRYTAQIKEMCFSWLKKVGSNDVVIPLLSKYPAGRLALIDSLSTDVSFGHGREIMDCVVARHKALAALNDMRSHGIPQEGIMKLLAIAEADPEHIETHLAEALTGSDAILAKAAAAALSHDQYLGKLGPATVRRVQKLADNPYFNQHPFTVLPPERPFAPISPFPQNPQEPAMDIRDTVSTALWQCDGVMAILIFAPAGILILRSASRGGRA